MVSNNTMQKRLADSFLKYRDYPAIEYKNKQITYQMLDQYSNRVAHWITRQGIQVGSNIGVMITDKSDLVVAILGIIKARCVFVPLDAKYPWKRTEAMLQIAETVCILTDEVNESWMQQSELPFQLALLDLIISQGDVCQDGSDQSYDPDDPIYIYFTSGTTGKPKAILGRNESLVHFMMWEINEFQIAPGTRVSQLTSECHDPYLRDIFLPLFVGGVICIPEDQETIVNPLAIQRWLETAKVNHIHCTPSLFNIIQSGELTCERYPELRYVLLAGEKVVPKHLHKWYSIFGERVQLVNLYGPTETTLAKIFYRIQKEDVTRKSIPLGQSIRGSKAIILSPELRICGVNEVGEIYIRTPYRSLGYYQDPQLTAERFFQNPFSSTSGDFIYRTGDLGKLLDNENIEFVGRSDRQVKIRGFRVELNEIEVTLLQHPLVQEAVVMAHMMTDENQVLCAYLVSPSLDPANLESILREFLGQALPSYMIPTFYVRLDRLPLNPNGKVDYRALPEPVLHRQIEIFLPQTEAEKTIVKLWTDLLGVQQIGRDDRFFDLGGNSLNAMQLVLQIHKEFGVSIKLAQMFTNPMLQELICWIEHAEKAKFFTIQPVEEREYYPLSSAQRRMLLTQQANPNEINYNISVVLTLHGDVNHAAMEAIFQQLIERHEPLRTGFTVVNGDYVQRIHSHVDFHVEYAIIAEEKILSTIKQFIRSFDLHKPPLIRVGLYTITEEKHLLLIDLHHIVADLTSIGILVREFAQLYQGEPLPPMRIQYKDYAVWQDHLKTTEEFRRQETYWLNQLAGEIPLLDFPTDFKRPTVKSYEGESLTFTLPSEIVKQVKDLAKQQHVTLYMLLLAVYNIILYKYTNQDEIIVGAGIADRPHADLNNMVGMFVNILAIKNHPQGEKTFRQFLEEVRKHSLAAFDNQDYQFEDLVEKLNVKRESSRMPLFDTLFVLQNAQMDAVQLNGLHIEPYSFDKEISRYDLTLSAGEMEDEVRFHLVYSTKLFRRSTMERFRDHFLNLIQAITLNPDDQLWELKMITAEEERRLCFEWNDTKKVINEEILLHQLVEEQVRKTPEQVALVYQTREIRYRELNEKANQIGRLLRQRGVNANSVVGIILDQPVERIVAILGILKAGGAYLPIDPAYPDARKRYIMENSQMEMVITRKGILEPQCIANVVDIFDPQILEQDVADWEPINTTSDLAYVIYTSGSTGQPKGVMVEHRNCVNTLLYRKDVYDLTPGKIALQLFTYAFDGFVVSLFTPLITGAKLVLLSDDELKDINKIRKMIAIHAVTYILSVPNLYQAIIETLTPEETKSLEMISLVGDQVLPIMLELTAVKNPQIRLVNEYGVTEAAVASTLNKDWRPEASQVIGKPNWNTQIYIMDSQNQLKPIGVPGELCIGGKGVGRGYVNHPELTRQRFVANPFRPGERMYRTGDLARWREDGTVEFLGRMDTQVKIRGYRIELAEIENILLGHPQIQTGVVIVKESSDGEKSLCAYIVGDQVYPLEIKEYLTRVLPQYLVPDQLIVVDHLPLNPNGKLDRKALLEMEGETSATNSYMAPRSETERTLAEIWQEILLSKDKIGIHDDFFKLGGHSLRVMSLTRKIHERFDVQVPLEELFERPTIHDLGKYIERASLNQFSSIRPVEEQEYYPLSSAQRRMYVVSQFNKDSINYNLPAIMLLQGKVEPERLEEIFRQMISRHEILRTSFVMVDGEVYQKIHHTFNFKMNYFQARPDEAEEMVKSFIRPFNLSKAPLIRIGLIKLDDERSILMVDMHHIISDGVSKNIIINEFGYLYAGQPLDAPKIHYKDYAFWQQQINDSPMVKMQEAYWLDRYKDHIPPLVLPTDYPDEQQRNFKGSQLSFSIDSEVASKLKQIMSENHATLFMMLLAAYEVLLYKYSGQNEIVVGSPIAGRQHRDVSNMIGMFVNMLAFKNRLDDQQTFRELLAQVRTTALEAYQNQDYQFEELVEKLGLQRDLRKNPLFETVFALQSPELDDDEAVAEEFRNLKISPYKQNQTIARFALTLFAFDEGQEIRLSFRYATQLFKSETIERMKRHFLQIMEAITANVDVRLREIPLDSDLVFANNQIPEEEVEFLF